MIVETVNPSALSFAVKNAYFSHDGYRAMYKQVGTGTLTTNTGDTVEGVIFEDEEGNKVFVPNGQDENLFNGFTMTGPWQQVTGKPCEPPDDDDNGAGNS
ncbi:MAG: hypothetical protein KTR31_37100 [Myxococcales bacterium]|nr:hypothetical protein [Myxococcales bacterium]